MMGSWTRVVVAVAAVVLLGAWGVASGAGVAPVDATAGAPGNDSAAAVVEAQGASLATPVESPGATGFYSRVSSFAAAYNEEQPDLGPAGEVASGSVVNLHVTGGDGGETVVSFRLTEDNRIENLRAGPRDDAKVRIELDAGTFDRIASARRPGEAFRRALDDGRVSVSGRDAISGTVWAIQEFLRGVLGGG